MRIGDKIKLNDILNKRLRSKEYKDVEGTVIKIIDNEAKIDFDGKVICVNINEG